MSEPSKPEKKPAPNSNPNSANSWMIYAVLGILISISLFSIVNTSLIQTVSYPDLMALIAKTRYVEPNSKELDPNFDGTLIVSNGNTKYQGRLERHNTPSA